MDRDTNVKGQLDQFRKIMEGIEFDSQEANETYSLTLQELHTLVSGEES